MVRVRSGQVNYTYLTTGELKQIKQSSTVLATYVYDNAGSRTAVTFLNGASQSFGFDPISRLSTLGNDLSGAASDLTKTFAYNPANQIVTETRSNDAYGFPLSTANETGVANGRNQLTSYAGKSLSYVKGNVTVFGSDSFGYTSENLMTSAIVGGTSTTLAYDPGMRLYETASGGTTSRFAYDGLNALAEYNGSGALQRRWVFDPTTGQPVVWYEGTGTGATAKRYFSADERDSVISVSDNTGASLGIKTYDEYGIPDASNLGRYGYTGQAWLPTVHLWHLNARVYQPALGRFMQTDPIGYWDSPNLYQYVLNDPTNFRDSLGLGGIIVTACRDQTKTMVNGTCVDLNQFKSQHEVNQNGIDPGSGVITNDACSITTLLVPITSVGKKHSTSIDILKGLGSRVLGVATILLSLGSDTRRQSPDILRHYTDLRGYTGIVASGVIRPTNSYIYLTPDYYSSGATAQAKLAMRVRPIGYFTVPSSRALPFSAPSKVEAANNQPGGGTQVTTSKPIPVKPSEWTPICH